MALSISFGHLSTATAGAWSNPAVSEMRQHNTTIYGTPISLHDWELDMLGKLNDSNVLPFIRKETTLNDCTEKVRFKETNSMLSFQAACLLLGHSLALGFGDGWELLQVEGFPSW